MRIKLVTIVLLVTIGTLCHCSTKDVKKTSKTHRIGKRLNQTMLRDKRQLHYGYQPRILSHYQHQPQYVEAPEPIIEIIIKDSNETLPPPPHQAPIKKKKEQVQVFYVKYSNDHDKGLQIEQPIPALSPVGNDHSEEEEVPNVSYVTPIPPQKTTTLRTIIRPESETYQSDHSGVHITFGSSGSHDLNRYAYQHEDIEETAIQPVITSVNAPNHLDKFKPISSPQPHLQLPQYPPTQFHNGPHPQNGQPPLPPNIQFYAQQALTSNRFLPPFADTPSQPFRPIGPSSPSQSHYYQQNNKYFASSQQKFNAPTFQSSPAPPSPSPPTNYFQNTNNYRKIVRFPANNNFRSTHFENPPQRPNAYHPKSIPIHNEPQPTHSQSFIQSSSSNRFSQPLPNHQFNTNVGPKFVLPSVPPHSAAALNQYNQQQFVAQQQNHHEVNQPFNYNPQSSNSNQYLDQERQRYNHQQQLYIQQQQEKLHQQHQQQQQFQRQPPPPQPQLPHPQPSRIPQPDHIQNIVSGGELVESVPKYEQHLTERVPLSEINFPFGRPNPSPTPQIPQTQSAQFDLHNQFSGRQNFQVNQISPSIQIQPQVLQSQNTPLPPIQNDSPFIPSTHFPIRNHQIYNDNPNGPSGPAPINVQYQPQPSVQPLPQHNEPLPIPQDNPHLQFVSHHQQFTNPPVFATSPPRPGQSVSTLHSDALAEIEAKRQQYFGGIVGPNQGNAIGEQRHKATTEHVNFVTVTSKPSSERPSTAAPTTPTPSNENKPNVVLPDEVPDDLRQQLLSSGILDNADISVLDYDKIGATALENLPPEHLANFYGSGGGSQIASSNKVVHVVKPSGEKINVQYPTDEKYEPVKSKLSTKENVDLKVVRFDSTNQKSITDKYIQNNAQILSPVDVKNPQYNRYLPLKINGAQFPIPDVAALRGKKISSVVVLAPVDNLQSIDENDDGRVERDIIESRNVKFLAGDSLKQLLKKPSKENYKKWLDKESKTNIESQSVVLLVLRNDENNQEIFMYDIATQEANKLTGELSSAFVNVAETNASAQDIENTPMVDSGIVERMTDRDIDLDSSPSEPVTYKTTDRKGEQILISSSYSVIKS